MGFAIEIRGLLATLVVPLLLFGSVAGLLARRFPVARPVATAAMALFALAWVYRSVGPGRIPVEVVGPLRAVVVGLGLAAFLGGIGAMRLCAGRRVVGPGWGQGGAT